MLTLDENARPTAEQLLQDPWCKEELRENPDLAYLGHRQSPPLYFNPPPPPPPPISEFGKAFFWVMNSKYGDNRGGLGWYCQKIKL